MKTKSFFSAFALSCFGVLAVAGCAAGGAETTEAPAEGPTATSEAPLVSGGGGGGLSFSCGPLGCICHGDFDCNNMFGSGVCDGLNAKCYERGPGPVYCICGGPFTRAGAAGGVVATPGKGGGVLSTAP